MKRALLALAGVATAGGLIFSTGLGPALFCGRGYHFVWTAGNKHGLYMRCLICKTELELRNDDHGDD